MANGPALKARQLTQLQWEFILTAWRQSLDFAAVRQSSRFTYEAGMFAFYYARGRWVHGPQFKYPAMRFAGVSEEKLAPHLYLRRDTDCEPEPAARQPRLTAKHAGATLEQLARMQDGQPFNIYGNTRVKPSSDLPILS
jgi:hypothetical protein